MLIEPALPQHTLGDGADVGRAVRDRRAGGGHDDGAAGGQLGGYYIAAPITAEGGSVDEEQRFVESAFVIVAAGVVDRSLGQGSADDSVPYVIRPRPVSRRWQTVGLQVEGHGASYVGRGHGGAATHGVASATGGGQNADARRSDVDG